MDAENRMPVYADALRSALRNEAEYRLGYDSTDCVDKIECVPASALVYIGGAGPGIENAEDICLTLSIFIRRYADEEDEDEDAPEYPDFDTANPTEEDFEAMEEYEDWQAERVAARAAREAAGLPRAYRVEDVDLLIFATSGTRYHKIILSRPGLRARVRNSEGGPA